jgi:hypothetical protein
MSRKAARPRRSSMRMLLAAVALLLVSAVMWAGPVMAHTFTRNDPNDSRGRLDLRSVSVSHTSTAVVHKVRTYESWTPKTLGRDSFFLIQIDKNNDRNYERCAFIFFAGGRLRGSLTNCGNTFIRSLPVAKLSGTTAKITIPKTQTGNVYWWAVASRWEGPAPCGACIDFAPDNFPDILHDMIPPVVGLEPSPLRVWENSTSANFTFPFSVTDAHSRIKSWTVQRRQVGSPSWTFVTSGTSGGPKSPDVVGAEGTRSDYRVVAVDNQGNQRIRIRRVYIPRDDDTLGPEGVFSVAPTIVSDETAFGGTYSEMSSGTFTYTWTPGTDCLFELIGPGSGTWDVTVTPVGGSPTNITDVPFPDQPRQTLYSDATCATSYLVTWNSGTFGLDAVLG